MEFKKHTPRPPRPPVSPVPAPTQTPASPPVELPLPAPMPLADAPAGIKVKKRMSRKKKVIIGSSVTLGLVATILVGAWLWYQSQLSPVGTNENEKIAIIIESGSTPAMIGQLLEDRKIIRSNQAFSIYTRLSGTQDSLQAGTYRLSPAETTPEIVKHLTSGNVDTFSIRFLPGATLQQNKKVFIEAGYSEQEVDAAFSATYDSPLFATKPAGADLEGYIYGETYIMGSGASVGDILEYTFETFNDVIVKNGLVAKFQAQNLSLYEGIILASIIQRESGGNDQADIAQVFFNRIARGMALGSDVTYQYIADKTGVPRDTNLDSPYNTRRYPGLPPGPIAAPGLQSLLAVANPSKGDYLYFLSGDDDVTYFGRTNEEHEKNIVDHCKVKCSIL